MRIKIHIFSLFCFLGSSCDDEKKAPHILIKTGKECGWSGGADSLLITKASSTYAFVNPCDETKNKEEVEETSHQQWSDLLGSLD